MVSDEILRQAQMKMFDILLAIDDVCKKHNVKYWLGYGTLLGAVRHKGFIPWDDDCDICMMRSDFEKFEKVAHELPEHIFLQTPETDPGYHKKMVKVRMKNTKLVEFDESENEKYHQGIFVDVFVWDYHPVMHKVIFDSISFINQLRIKRKKYPKGSLRRSAIQLALVLPYWGYSAVMKLIIFVSRSYRDNESLPLVGMKAALRDRFLFEKDTIFPLSKCVFEGKEFPVPHNSGKFLGTIYGDYLTLPPVEERHFHARQIEI